MSRSKGIRVEYLVRNYFRELGYEAERVPGSGAFAFRTGKTSLKGDVQVSKNGEPLFKVEVKAKKAVFNSIYKLYFANRDGGGGFRFTVNGIIVALNSDFPDLLQNNCRYFPDVTTLPYVQRRTYEMIARLHKLLGECQYLAIKGNNQRILFIKFWAV